MPKVGIRHVIKEGAVSLTRSVTGAVTGNAYIVDQFGRLNIDTTDLPQLLANGNWAIDGPAGMGFYSGSGAPTLMCSPGIILRPQRRQLKQHAPLLKLQHGGSRHHLDRHQHSILIRGNAQAAITGAEEGL